MAEYIDRENVKNLIEVAIEDSWELDYTLDRLKEVNSADVIERVEYEKLKKENEELKNILADKSVLEEDGYYKTSCNLIKKVFDMDFKMQKIEHSKIDKTIAEIKELYTEWENSTDDARLESNPFGAVLNIIQRNIGE